MDREIKFRVWEKNHKKWIDDFAMFLTTGELLKYDRKAGGEYETVMRTEEAMKELLDYDYKSIEVIQYTGLRDEYGKEIYEKDIVTDAVGRTWLIQYSVKLCSFVFNWINKKSITNEIQTLQNFNSAQLPFTKEGNIYANPELLNQQEVKK